METTPLTKKVKNILICNHASDLNKIHLENISIAVYERQIPQLKNDIIQLIQNKIIFEETANIDELTRRLKSYIKALNISTPFIIKDISTTLNLFQDITHALQFRLSIKTITSDMCTKFHTDYNTLRLLCTYQGPSTLYILNDCRNFLEKEVGTGNIAILKGNKYPHSIAVQHRSPAVEKENKTRLLLKIDCN